MILLFIFIAYIITGYFISKDTIFILLDIEANGANK